MLANWFLLHDWPYYIRSSCSIFYLDLKLFKIFSLQVQEAWNSKTAKMILWFCRWCVLPVGHLLILALWSRTLVSCCQLNLLEKFNYCPSTQLTLGSIDGDSQFYGMPYSLICSAIVLTTHNVWKWKDFLVTAGGWKSCAHLFRFCCHMEFIASGCETWFIVYSQQ